MKKRKEPVFTIGSFFGSKFDRLFRCKKNLSRRFTVSDERLPLLSPFALFPSLLKIHHSLIHHKQLLITIIPPFPLALSTFYFTLQNSPFTNSPFTYSLLHNWLFIKNFPLSVQSPTGIFIVFYKQNLTVFSIFEAGIYPINFAVEQLHDFFIGTMSNHDMIGVYLVQNIRNFGVCKVIIKITSVPN